MSLYNNRILAYNRSVILYINQIPVQLSQHIEQLSIIWTLLGIYNTNNVYAINYIIN